MIVVSRGGCVDGDVGRAMFVLQKPDSFVSATFFDVWTVVPARPVLESATCKALGDRRVVVLFGQFALHPRLLPLVAALFLAPVVGTADQGKEAQGLFFFETETAVIFFSGEALRACAL